MAPTQRHKSVETQQNPTTERHNTISHIIKPGEKHFIKHNNAHASASAVTHTSQLTVLPQF